MTTRVKHSIRRTLLALGAGMVLQRVCQLAGFLLIGRALGVAGLGIYAEGQALAAVLGVIAGAGTRNLTARLLTSNPESAQALVFQAVQRRLQTGALMLLPVIAMSTYTSSLPWFWLWCALQVLPNAFDLKNLLDATGRTGREVRLESAIAVLHLLLVLAWAAWTPGRLDVLAAIALGSRCLYAVGSVSAIAKLPRSARLAAVLPRQRAMASALTAHELLTIGDVWLVAVLLGDDAAGLYAIGVRFAAAALLPSSQLARLLLPHLLRAGIEGDARTALATALRSTLLITWPMLAGGFVAAAALCQLGGAEFVAAAPALRLLLLAGCLQHLGWQCSHSLLASHHDRTFINLLAGPAMLHVGLVGLVAWLWPAEPELAATAAAGAAAVAQATFALVGLCITHTLWIGRRQLWQHPGGLAILTGTAAALPLAFAESPWLLPLQLLVGAAGFLFGLWWLELRGRWRRLGDGLAAASGFAG